MNKRRIFVSSLVGAIALVGLSVSLTLAWYASSDRLSVRSLDVGVAGSADLRLSTSPELDTFASAIDLSPSEEFVFVPVSTLGRTNWSDNNVPEFFDCSFDYVSSTGEPDPEKMSYGFFQQKIYLLTNLDYYVTLDVNPTGETRENDWSTFVSNDEVNFARAKSIEKQMEKDNPSTNVDVNEIKDKLDELIKCLRISILVTDEDDSYYYIIDPTKKRDDANTVFGGRLDNDRDGYYDTYEDENGDRREIVYGEVSETSDRSKIVYSDPIDTSAVEEEKPVVESFFWNSFEAESSKKTFTYDEAASKANGFALKEEKAYSLEELDSEKTELRIPCFANTPKAIVVSIYLEGWDLDCINSTMGASFITNLRFKLLRGIN